MLRLRQKFHLGTNFWLLLLNILALSVIFYFKGGKFLSEISRVILEGTSRAASSEILSDPGLIDGENIGCKYSSIDGLVYFCGFVKSSKNSDPVSGVTVAVYEELPKNQSALDPTGLASGTGKYGGNLVHLFTSTTTNDSGHFEVTGRQGQTVYVAFFCEGNLLAGLKRVQNLSRIENLNEFVDCSSGGSKVEPPKQLNYVDRKGFLECTTDFLSDVVDAAAGQSGPDSLVNVGYSSTPTSLALSEIKIDNFDFRFMPTALATSVLKIGAANFGRLSDLLDFGLRDIGETPANQLTLDAKWLATTLYWDGPWRKEDCEATYENGYKLCDIPSTNDYLREQGLVGGDDLYLVMNHLRFLPPWSSAPAFARVDIRSDLRQLNQSNSAIARFMDAVFGNYIGIKQIVKQPDSDPSITEEEFAQDDQIISCDALKAASGVDRLKQTAGPGSLLRSPGELEKYAELGLTDKEKQSPVCRNSDQSLVSVQEACFDKPYLGLCRPEHLIPKATGSSAYSFTGEEDSDSANSEPNVIRESQFNPFVTATDTGFDRGQKDVILTGERNINAARNINSATYISGGLLGTNFLGVFNSPGLSGSTQLETEKSATDLEKEKLSDTEEEKSKEDLEKGKIAEEEQPVLVPAEKPSVNALRGSVIVEDVGSDSVAHCTLSTIFGEAEGNTLNGLTRSVLDAAGFAGKVKNFVSNFFTGNTQHATNQNVATGVFYTEASLARDSYLNQLKGSSVTFWKDVFDGLRSTASGQQSVDFSTLSGLGDLAAAIIGASKVSPTKTFSDRQAFVANPNSSLTISYPLTEENFDTVFPPVSRFSDLLPSDWGSHDNYPWISVPEGRKCSTHVENPADGTSSTCRVARCGTATVNVECNGSSCDVEGGFEDFEENCTQNERLQCARDQESTEPELTPNRERTLAGICATSGECEFEEEFSPVCVMERAGPYREALSLDGGAANLLTQQNKKQNGQLPVDSLASSMESLSRAFRSPAEQELKQVAIADADIAQSASPDNEGVVTQGYTVPGIGGASQGLYTPAAPVTISGAGVDNELVYHCNNIGVPVDGTVAGGDWNCPIAAVPVCSGLFGLVSGIDKIPVSLAGQTSIRTTFSLTDFQASLPVYAQIEEDYGIPCEVMAGIHYREAGNNPNGSFEDGGPLRNGNLLEDGILVAEDLLADMGATKKPGGLAITTLEGWSEALLHHNGYGNNNCSAPATLTSYRKCPAQFPGEDNNYIMAYADSNHDNMAIIYPADGVKSDQFCRQVCTIDQDPRYQHACDLCPPPIEEQRVGALVMAKYLYNLVKDNSVAF